MARDGSPAARASSSTSSVLSRLFRGRFLTMLIKAHAQGRLKFFGDHAALADKRAFKRFLAPLRKIEWVVYSKNPVRRTRAGAALSLPLYPPRRHLQSPSGLGRRQRRRLPLEGLPHRRTRPVEDDDAHPHEFIRRFLIHVLPKGFHRIRHYGLFANSNRAANIARARQLLGAAPRVVEHEEQKAAASDEPRVLPCPCPRCGGRMIVIEVFARGCEPTYRPTPAPTPIRIDTS